MAAISPQLLDTIYELQNLPSFEKSALGGGTNLAIRYAHRISTDIDIFFPDIIGRAGFQGIEKDVQRFYGTQLFGLQYPCNIDEQFIFLRFFLIKDGETIKVEVMQNMVMLDGYEMYEGIRMVSEQDIALFKLMSAANRASQKDIYDLDYLTENFDLILLHQTLSKKQKMFSDLKFQNIFDQDNEVSPVAEPLLLLKFDEGRSVVNGKRPAHSQNRIEVMEGAKNWNSARSSWRSKVRKLFNHLGIDFPSIKAQ